MQKWEMFAFELCVNHLWTPFEPDTNHLWTGVGQFLMIVKNLSYCSSNK
jgi:hypothetical protein